MKRARQHVVPLYEQYGIDVTQTVIVGADDPGLRDHGSSILFACAKGKPGLGIVLSLKHDPFNGMPGKHDFSFNNMMHKTNEWMASRQEILVSLSWFSVELQMNEYQSNPNAPGMNAVMCCCYTYAKASGILTEIVPPLTTANSFPYLFPTEIPATFEPSITEVRRRRYKWNKQCICRVADQITTPREFQMIQTINENMKTDAIQKGYKGFGDSLDDFLDPFSDNAALMKRMYSEDEVEYDLIALRMKYMRLGYTVRYLVFVTKNEPSAAQFPQEWRENASKKRWDCVIRISPSIPLAKLLLQEFTFDVYVTDDLSTYDKYTWVHLLQNPVTWDDLFSCFPNDE